MLPIVLGFVAGLVLGALAFVLLKGGLLGLGVGAVVAVLGYVAVSALAERPRRIGDMAAELVPDGEAALRAIDEATARVASIGELSSRIIDRRVNGEAADFIAATNALIRYVNTDPHAYQTLRHYINVYGAQTESLLKGYLDVERSGVGPQIAKARDEAIEALQALEMTAAGELQRAVAAKTLALSADSEAIVRLASMDGYVMPDKPAGGAADAEADQAGGHAADGPDAPPAMREDAPGALPSRLPSGQPSSPSGASQKGARR